MSKRLWYIITIPSSILALIFGLLMFYVYPSLLMQKWMVVKLGSIFLEVFQLFKPKPKPSKSGKKWVRPEIEDGKKSSESNIQPSYEVNIGENTLVSDQISALKSGNKSSDIS